MNYNTGCFLAIFLILASLCIATPTHPLSSQLKHSNPKPTNQNNNKGGGNDAGTAFGDIFGPGSGFNIPGFGVGIAGGGYGGGNGGPDGGRSKNGVIRPTVVCKERGPCYMKKLTCPAKCFTSYSSSGKGYGGGGGGGGCTMDCKKKCIAYC